MMARKQIYLTYTEVETFNDLAETMGISTSEYIRRVIDEHLQKEKDITSKLTPRDGKMIRKQIYLTSNEVYKIDALVLKIKSTAKQKISASEYIRRILDDHIRKSR